MWGLNIWDLLARGGMVMWPLLFCSVLSVAITIERLCYFAVKATRYSRFQSQLEKMMRGNDIPAAEAFVSLHRSPLARVAKTYLSHLSQPSTIRQEAATREASLQLTHLERRLGWLSIIGTLAPMIGLLGTVIGLVDAFQQIELAGGQVQPSDLAAGIWKALLTTVFGLIVALPTLAIFHVFDSRVGSLALQMQWLVAHLNEWTSTTSHETHIVSPTGTVAPQPAPGSAPSAQPAALSVEEG
ncbi:MAG: MotA/TolQ/ExbB proton channel family protein [Planctomycetota bacterium]|nr:MotA/TolQ/ExbB proton channel family protein [Planctomycetota bacterium]